MRYGLDMEVWTAACEEARSFLVDCARDRRTTTYGQLADAIRSARIRPYSFAMMGLLSEACRDFDDVHGTVLASLVCRKDSGMPGEGYFAWGERSGRCEGDRCDWWSSELRKVYDCVE